MHEPADLRDRRYRLGPGRQRGAAGQRWQQPHGQRQWHVHVHDQHHQWRGLRGDGADAAPDADLHGRLGCRHGVGERHQRRGDLRNQYLFDWRYCLGPGRQCGAAGQRRQQPHRQRQWRIHVHDQDQQRHDLCGDGADAAHDPDLHGHLGRGHRVGERDERGGHLRDQYLFDRGYGLGPRWQRGAAGQRWQQPHAEHQRRVHVHDQDQQRHGLRGDGADAARYADLHGHLGYWHGVCERYQRRGHLRDQHLLDRRHCRGPRWQRGATG